MRKTLLNLTILCLVAGAAWAQLRVDVQLVNVVATVTDSKGRYVPDLTAEDFTLEEDGKKQQISHFSLSTDQPISVGILLDSSGSMERKISTATRAVDRFLRSIHADDEIFLMTFDDSVKVRQDFTSNRDKLWTALDKVRLAPGTSLYDAVIAGTDKIRKGKYPKKAILLLTDGMLKRRAWTQPGYLSPGAPTPMRGLSRISSIRPSISLMHTRRRRSSGRSIPSRSEGIDYLREALQQLATLPSSD